VQPVVPHLVACVEVDQHSATVGAREEDARLALSARFDRREVPALHAAKLAPRPGDDYCTSSRSLNIGRYIAITMIPMIAPTPIIISGSMIEVRAAIDVSTSSS
jgi:hypothetical protein